MIKKFAIISFGFFILAGNFSSFKFFNSIPIDISIISMILPGLYFVFHTLKIMSVHKSFFVNTVFFTSLIPIIFYLKNDNEKTVMFLMIFFVLSLISPVLLDSEESIKLFVNSLIVTSLIIVALALFGLENTHTTGRLTLNGGNPIWLGRAVSIAAFCLLIFFIHNKIRLVRFLIIFVPTIFIMISTGSKGPIVAMFIALMVIYFSNLKKFISNKRTFKSVILFLFFIIPIGLISYMLFPNPFVRLFETTTIEDNSARLILYNDAIRTIVDNPTGIGLGNFSQYSFFDYPHNLILEAFVELGWSSGLLLFLMIVFSFIGLMRISKDNLFNGILLGLFILSLTNSMVSGDLTSPKELYLLIPIGLNVFISTFQTNSRKTHVVS